MMVYAIGSAGLALSHQADLRQTCSPQQQDVGVRWPGRSSRVFLLKGIGSYVSSYLMADVGQRVVMDLRNALYRHILDQSAGFFAHGATGRLLSRINNDVGQVQQAVSETAGGSGARVARARRLRGAAVLLRRAADDRLPDRRAAHRLPADPPRPARAAHDAAQPGSARAAVAPQHRSVHRPSHRQGVRDRGARGREVQRAPATICSART